MEFTTEMSRIGRQISRAAEERAGRLCRIRADTQQLLSVARANLRQVASRRRRQAASERVEVLQSRNAAVRLRQAHHKQAAEAHHKQATEARERAAESRGTTRRAVYRLRAKTKRFLREAGARHEEVSNRTKEGLVHFVDGLRSEVDGLLQKSHGRQREFAADFRGGARLFHKTLRRAAMFAEPRDEKPAMTKAHGAPRPASHRGFPTSGRRAAHAAQHRA